MRMNDSAARRLRLAGAIGLVGLLSACEPSMEEVVAKHREPVQAVFDKLKALDATVRDAPPPAEDRIDAGGATILLDGELENALFIRADDLAAPELADADPTGATRAGTVEGCGEALRGEFSGVPGGADLFLQDCARAEFVFVLRTHLELTPEVIDDESFKPGRYEGDVLLYRLADGAALGGFRITAENGEQVMAPMDSSGNVLDVAGRLQADLESKVFVAIDEKLKALVPGVIP